MTASTHHDLPLPQPEDMIGFRLTPEQELLVRRAAELSGWTFSEYILCAVLDRAERELHEHAARMDWEHGPRPLTTEPFDSLVGVYGEL